MRSTGSCGGLFGVGRLVGSGLVDRRMVRLGLGLARGHDRRRNQGSYWQNKDQRGDQALERGNHERVLRVCCEGGGRVNSRGEFHLIDCHHFASLAGVEASEFKREDVIAALEQPIAARQPQFSPFRQADLLIQSFPAPPFQH
jgi:hypothetical protein